MVKSTCVNNIPIEGTTVIHSVVELTISTSKLSRIVSYILQNYPDRCKLDARLFSGHFTERKFINEIVSGDSFEYGRFGGPEYFDQPGIRQTNRWNMHTILRSERCRKVKSSAEAFDVMYTVWEQALKWDSPTTMNVEYKIFKIASLFQYLVDINKLPLRYRLSIPTDTLKSPILYIVDESGDETSIPYRGNGLLSYIIEGIQTIMETYLQISRYSKIFTSELLYGGLDVLLNIVEMLPTSNVMTVSSRVEYDASLDLEWFRHVELKSNDPLLNGIRFYTQPLEGGYDMLVDNANTYTKLYLLTQRM